MPDSTISYYVFVDRIDYDDHGEEQVSIYSQRIDSKRLLTPDEAIDLAEERGDWKIRFGEGDWDRIDTYVIEEVNPSGARKIIVDGHELPTLNPCIDSAISTVFTSVSSRHDCQAR